MTAWDLRKCQVRFFVLFVRARARVNREGVWPRFFKAENRTANCHAAVIVLLRLGCATEAGARRKEALLPEEKGEVALDAAARPHLAVDAFERLARNDPQGDVVGEPFGPQIRMVREDPHVPQLVRGHRPHLVVVQRLEEAVFEGAGTQLSSGNAGLDGSATLGCRTYPFPPARHVSTSRFRPVHGRFFAEMT
jgi:hypothetical protein